MPKIRLNWFPHDISCGYACVSVCVWAVEGKRRAGGGAGVSALWWGPLTMPSFHRWAVHRARPTSCPSLPVQLYSLPDPSVWCKWYGREGGSLPLMFSLGTGCCLFDFQSKQRQHLQFEQIVQCCPEKQRATGEEKRTGSDGPPCTGTFIHHKQICTSGASEGSM